MDTEELLQFDGEVEPMAPQGVPNLATILEYHQAHQPQASTWCFGTIMEQHDATSSTSASNSGATTSTDASGSTALHLHHKRHNRLLEDQGNHKHGLHLHVHCLSMCRRESSTKMTSWRLCQLHLDK
eukprot:TRINITY_DN8224_c0_g1_i3.p3 TRINITY_DN8224_c0_g1~~TRINITY_DN8224_c0_g1_i3.p3  ORF type:complete len:134 (-),score=25.39 TRINITY_DN8224_c0_g1_i3:702-1082(-)